MPKEQIKNSELILGAISPDDALRMYKDGAFKFRKPKSFHIGGGDVNSQDFRGFIAAGDVAKAFPYELDTEGQRTPVEPQDLKAHMDLGLAAIRDAGGRPLARNFVRGYKRATDLFTSPEESISTTEQVHPHLN